MFYHETAFLATFLLPSCYLVRYPSVLPSYIPRISLVYPSNIKEEITAHYQPITCALPVQEALS